MWIVTILWDDDSWEEEYFSIEEEAEEYASHFSPSNKIISIHFEKEPFD